MRIITAIIVISIIILFMVVILELGHTNYCVNKEDNKADYNYF